MSKILPNYLNDVRSLKIFSRIRLVVIDLDGTLIQSGAYNLYDNILTLHREINHPRYGVRLTLATGRTLTGVSLLLNKLALPKSMPIILYNGSMILRSSDYKALFQKTIPHTSLCSVVDVAMRYKVPVLAYFFDNSQKLDGYPNEFVLGWSKQRHTETEFNNMQVRWQEEMVEDAINPTSILIDISSILNELAELESSLTTIDHISWTRSGSSYVEIRPQGSNKAVALEHLAKLLELSREEILALGDNDNDAEMLSWAGIGVAVARASPAAKESSDYLCRHDVAGGAVEVLRLIKHARYYFYKPKALAREEKGW